MEQFKIGDCVELKSGSPKMTVNKVQLNFKKESELQTLNCTWFDKDNVKHEHTFTNEALKKVSCN